MPGLMPRQLAAMGRGGDDEVAHVTTGEIVIPRNLADSPTLRDELTRAFERAGIPIGRYTVGGKDDSRNPATGMREYYGFGEPGRGGDTGPDAGRSGGFDSAETGSSGNGGSGSASGGGENKGGNRASHPSRATPGAGYHAGPANESGTPSLTPQAVGLAARNPDAHQEDYMDVPDIGYYAAFSSILDAITNPEEHAARAKMADARLDAWNEGRRAIGAPHFSPETGAWTTDTLGQAFDIGSWHRAPGWAQDMQRERAFEESLVRGDGSGGLLPRRPVSTEVPTDGPPARGFYTPPYDPAAHGPSWQKYLDV